jgi:hypothetical protein
MFQVTLIVLFFLLAFINLKPSHYSHLPAYEDGTECSETSAYKIQSPGNYPEESVQHSEHGESLKSRIYKSRLILIVLFYPLALCKSRFCIQLYGVVLFKETPHCCKTWSLLLD